MAHFQFKFAIVLMVTNLILTQRHLNHGGNTIGTTCVVDRDDTAYMVVDREFRLPTEKYGCRYTTQNQCVVNRTSKTRENRFLIIADRQRGI